MGCIIIIKYISTSTIGFCRLSHLLVSTSQADLTRVCTVAPTPAHQPRQSCKILANMLSCIVHDTDLQNKIFSVYSSVETNNYFGTNRISNIIRLMKIKRIEYWILFAYQENIRILFEYLEIFEYSNIFE